MGVLQPIRLQTHKRLLVERFEGPAHSARLRFQRGQNLCPVVVQGGGRIRDLEAQLFETRGIVPDEIRLQRAKRGLRGFPSSAHFAQARNSLVSVHFNDGADKAAPVSSVRMTQWRFERYGNRRRPDVGDLHSVSIPSEQFATVR